MDDGIDGYADNGMDEWEVKGSDGGQSEEDDEYAKKREHPKELWMEFIVKQGLSRSKEEERKECGQARKEGRPACPPTGYQRISTTGIR